MRRKIKFEKDQGKTRQLNPEIKLGEQPKPRRYSIFGLLTQIIPKSEANLSGHEHAMVNYCLRP